MEKLFSMIEGPTSNEVTTLEQITQETMPEFLSKISIWDYYEMTKEQHTNKSESDKTLLILQY